MPAGYVIAEIAVNDASLYEEYRLLAQESIARHGGHYLVRGGKTELLEGEPEPERIVILAFDSLEQATRFYHSDDYQEARAIRQLASTGRLVLVEGI